MMPHDSMLNDHLSSYDRLLISIHVNLAAIFIKWFKINH